MKLSYVEEAINQGGQRRFHGGDVITGGLVEVTPQPGTQVIVHQVWGIQLPRTSLNVAVP